MKWWSWQSFLFLVTVLLVFLSLFWNLQICKSWLIISNAFSLEGFNTILIIYEKLEFLCDFQIMSNFPSIQCVRRKFGPPDNVSQSSVIADTTEWQWPSSVPDWWHIPSSCELIIWGILWSVGLQGILTINLQHIFTLCTQLYFVNFGMVIHNSLVPKTSLPLGRLDSRGDKVAKLSYYE